MRRRNLVALSVLLCATSTEHCGGSCEEEQIHQNLRPRNRKRNRKERNSNVISVDRLHLRTRRRNLQDRVVDPLPTYHPTYISAFERIRPTSAWPLPYSSREYISSTFGPRELLNSPACTESSCYDFNPGVDIEASEGDPVVSVHEGTVKRVTSMSCGGLVIDVEHTFAVPVTFRDAQDASSEHDEHLPIYKWYSRYEQLNESLVSEGQNIIEGQMIARVGTSGNCANATSPRLHFEVILSNSNEILHTTDPRVHPFLVFPRHNLLHWSPLITQTSDVSSHNDGVFQIEARDVQPNIWKFKVLIQRETFRFILRVRGSHEIDFNKRIGFDEVLPNNTTHYPNMLYTTDISKPYLLPSYFDRHMGIWRATLVVPAVWVQTLPVITNNGIPEVRNFKVSIWDTDRRRFDVTGPVIDVI